MLVDDESLIFEAGKNKRKRNKNKQKGKPSGKAASNQQSQSNETPQDKVVQPEQQQPENNSEQGQADSDDANVKDTASPKEINGFRLISEFKVSGQDPANRFSNFGKILKSAFMIGPSKAVISKGYVSDKQSAQPADTQSANTADSNNAENKPAEDSDKKESYNYSMLDAYMNIVPKYESYPVFEDGEQEGSGDTNQGNNNEPDSAPKQGDDNKPNDDNQQSDNKEGEPKQSSDEGDSFKPGPIAIFRVGIKGEGFTEWTVMFDKRAPVENAMNAVHAKKFKNAYLIASNGLKSDGLVPLKAATYINTKQKLPPAFIGHCRYGFDSGSDSGTEDNLTIALAVAPIDGKTNKPNEQFVITAVYNVTGDITGGKVGQALASLGKKLSDKVSGKSDRYGSWDRDDDGNNDSEKSQSDVISKFLKNSFKCVGDHTMYKEFLKIRKFIQKNIDENNLELESVNTDTVIPKLKGHLIYY